MSLFGKVAVCHILMTVLLKNGFCDNILFMVFMNAEWDSFEISVLNNTTCAVVYTHSCESCKSWWWVGYKLKHVAVGSVWEI